MKTSSLSDKQVQRIFEFTSQKYVKYYDVQLELVDHVGSQIEEMMIAEEGVQFEDALQQVYKGFGVYGFGKIVEANTRELSKFWSKKIWNYLLQYFAQPKIIVLLILSYGLYLLFSFSSGLDVEKFLVYLMVTCLGYLTIWRKLYSNRKDKQQTSIEYLLVKSYENVRLGLLGMWHLPFQLAYFILEGNSHYGIIVLSLVLAIWLIISYGLLFRFPEFLEEEVKQKYPEHYFEIAI